LNDAAGAVKDPETGVSTQARLRARMQVAGYDKGASAEAKKDARLAGEGGDLPIEALGSGSDFTPFMQHLGITTLSIEYGGEGEYGVYHSNYDTFEHYARFGDPTFAYGVTEAETAGHVVLRIADADVLPLQFTDFADTVGDYVEELHKLAEEKRKAAQELGKLLDQKVFTLAADPTRVVLPPAREPEVPYLNFAPFDNAVLRLKASAKAYDAQYARWQAGETTLGAAQIKELNGLLQGMEQALTTTRGLPNREWFKHLIYAPGMLTGYGVKTVPGVRESIESNQWDVANDYINVTATALTGYCDRLDRATRLLKGS
jgi:N-acetylated-alpha-linked acidic dipeptidase